MAEHDRLVVETVRRGCSALDRFGHVAVPSGVRNRGCSDGADVRARDRSYEVLDPRLEHGVRSARRAPDPLEAAQRLVDDRRQVGVVTERRHSPIAKPVAARTSSAVAGRPSTAVTRRSPAQSTIVGASPTTKTSDLTICPTSQPHAAAASAAVRGRVRQDAHLDVEPALGEPRLHLGGSGMHDHSLRRRPSTLR